MFGWLKYNQYDKQKELASIYTVHRRVVAGGLLQKMKQTGFTLIELMIVLAILAILLLVAIPGFTDFVAEGRLDTAKDKLVSSISLARSEAIKRGERVVVCRSDNAGTSCAGTSTNAGNADWSAGWLIFADEDQDNSIDTGELIRVQTDTAGSTTIQYSRGDLIIFNGLGMLVTAATGDETFIISDSSDASNEAGLSIRSTGRVRSCSDWNTGTHSCDDN